ncbi:carbamoyl phosphate synthase large subunit [Alcanivorax sp. HI0033]|jgi:carbamoyl-phosphate synthase large subunit|uniref:carbamoyl-phosphate synthase large subunit n=3 Tax=Alcanivorax TaxID=59753 RepID=UPI0007B80F5D|nr:MULTISPECIES: carbamoyl-phosphate synthase large subunit [unclassified Alcanivorax]KZX75399.1 carbamoyl phosphate synthase large subunit [Alcanivorax sp. HI0013]KZX76719.1 carbamoyl phosphate synthase large subunit [Alcanivorax sp. HI0011]KZY13142.1 carbamoyl phosphate synthase large subunit [Alcanivorax sp. HI0035]MEE3387316.1 carbamoyl-phosphate synthase large subunit [Pseudomonadota bacterium]KZX65625.1 carbamoyl phosphate synthase large subunit [Alcanivorax sp. HI0003]
MPKRTDIQSILIIGAGPIVIGQACEFDYSGAQACKALREEGFRVILVNSNPATIMTDPAMADATYIEPITWQTVAKIIEKERPDALLPTMGGQTALNCALDLDKHGVLAEFGVEMIGATQDAIDKAEDRHRFDQAMKAIGLECPRSAIAHNMEEANAALEDLGFPCIIRPSFTMGGSGGGVAYNREEFEEICQRGLDLSPTNELLIDESLLGWKEYEMEVVRDKKDNCIIVCSIENFDPMGVHTGDSITVAPAQTLTDKEFQIMRDASLAVLREIGVETGGSNVQFGVNPDNGRMVVIEMNPRVSRSSALASKATGFPIAKVAAKLAVGYTLDELQNEITGGKTPASFEPSIDYVVTKIPRFNFEKFAEADAVLTTQMKSVGEVMAIGRNFQESVQKALRGLETESVGFDPSVDPSAPDAREQVAQLLATPGPERIWIVGDAFRVGMTVDDVFNITKIDRWYLVQIEDLVRAEQQLAATTFSDLSRDSLYALKRKGFSDARLAQLLGVKEADVRGKREELGVQPIYKRVDTCAAEFSTDTAYMYSSYDEECEANPSDRDKIMVIGGGPNRIGQGIEFDYCCVHAAFAMKDDGYETIMVNCNPETVSTDYDTSDRLYFEPVTLEDVLAIVAKEKPKGVIVQYGGQTPLKLARALQAAGVPIIGTPPDAIDEAEDRERFQQMVNKLGLKQPPNRTARSMEDGVRLAEEIGYPLVVRPSYVLGGRAMEIVYSEAELRNYMMNAVSVSNDSPVLLDRFLDDAIEVDVDAVCDGTDVVIGGIMQHIEQAGVHSGDSACSLPPYSLDEEVQNVMRQQAADMALELGVIGLMNVQFAVKSGEVYVLEVNPRASRTVPYVSKCIGVSLAKVAARCMAGTSLKEQGFTEEVKPQHYFVKEAVFPFAKFPKVDPILGPEMKSTGEVMGVGATFAEAFGKASLGAGEKLPEKGTAFISVREVDKPAAIDVARMLIERGFNLVATRGTAKVISDAGLEVKVVNKVLEGRPHIVDMIKNDEIALIVNTTEGKQAIRDSFAIRRSALQHRVFYTTTITAAHAVCQALGISGEPTVRRLQDLHAQMQ